jgi:hypothetical protein
MKTTDDVVSSSATLVATVDLPDPDPPAIPIMSGFVIVMQAIDEVGGTHYARFRGNPNNSAISMKTRLILLASIVIGAGACNAFRHGDTTSTTAPTTLQVDNQGFVDMTIYAVRSVQRIRLGTAPGNRKTDLTIPPALLGGLTTLRFIADPIGGARPSVSEQITVAPGDTVGLMIPPL